MNAADSGISTISAQVDEREAEGQAEAGQHARGARRCVRRGRGAIGVERARDHECDRRVAALPTRVSRSLSASGR